MFDTWIYFNLLTNFSWICAIKWLNPFNPFNQTWGLKHHVILEIRESTCQHPKFGKGQRFYFVAACFTKKHNTAWIQFWQKKKKNQHFILRLFFSKEFKRHEHNATRTLLFILSHYWNVTSRVHCMGSLCAFHGNDYISTWHEFLSTAALLVYIVSCLYNKKKNLALDHGVVVVFISCLRWYPCRDLDNRQMHRHPNMQMLRCCTCI